MFVIVGGGNFFASATGITNLYLHRITKKSYSHYKAPPITYTAQEHQRVQAEAL
jgi:hypothetical protein